MWPGLGSQGKGSQIYLEAPEKQGANEVRFRLWTTGGGAPGLLNNQGVPLWGVMGLCSPHASESRRGVLGEAACFRGEVTLKTERPCLSGG